MTVESKLTNQFISCACGCGGNRPKFDKYGKERLYINGHSSKREVTEETRKKISAYKKGKKLSKETRAKISQSNKGRKLSEENKKKLIESITGNKNHNWKGDNVGYGSLHLYVRQYFPKSDCCQICGQIKRLDLACVTGIYNRDFKNWKYLCRRCHKRYDLYGTVNM
jgi:NUMOD3 motif-containing protein